MKVPKTPEGWAARLANLVYRVKDANHLNRFPIQIREIVIDYSQSAFPDSPITKIEGVKNCDGFEGMLMPIPGGKGEWGIIYNDSGKSPGRVNFSIAHELGHYLLHRDRYPNGKQCTTRDMMNWTSEEAQIEGEANRFAANILMPLDDFRDQVQNQERSIDLRFFESLSNRYEVSLTAAILRWLNYTDQRAMIVVGRDGFIDWSWSSKPLLKSGIFYRPKKETIALPPRSLAALRDPSIDNLAGIKHPEGVWIGNEEVREMAVITNDYGNMTISLLTYPRHHSGKFFCDEPEEEDLVDRFNKRFEGKSSSISNQD